MQRLNIAELIPAQLEKLLHKLSNYTMVKYDSLKEKIQHIDKKLPLFMPIWLIILKTPLGTLIYFTSLVPYSLLEIYMD